MFYNSFLVLQSQLAFEQEGKISLNGSDVIVRSFPYTSRWELTVELSSNNLPSELRACLRSGRKLPLESENIYLQMNRGRVILVQMIPSPKKYLHYKQYMENFLESLALWE